jgi:hypothetical protein
MLKAMRGALGNVSGEEIRAILETHLDLARQQDADVETLEATMQALEAAKGAKDFDAVLKRLGV